MSCKETEKTEKYYYIVYSHFDSYGSVPSTKYINGIFNTFEEANKRQFEICGKTWKLSNDTCYGNGYVAFINKIPVGSCKVELFTSCT